ncbi:ankyrin repeat-containing domain protein [Immersiella caudata]|uniref:Ankyrin repeat-containing domain protein n=1 Tax=Immersiella caudata TaxID=314043 RepID=A0AA40CBC1_9PEZI|nr:ankyrin repeat-containing domain protein [Immersiella caudata]
MFNNFEAIKLLVKQGYDLNQKDEDGDTPLLCTLHDKRKGPENCAAIVHYLLSQGADPRCRNKYGYTPAGLAMSVGFDLFKTLLSRCKDDERVLKDCWFKLSDNSVARIDEDFARFVELLLAEGVHVDTRDSRGNTLYFRCLGNETRMSILRDHRADPSVVNNDGENALFSLLQSAWKRSDYHQRAERLIADGIDPLSRDGRGNTLLHMAAGDWKDDARHIEWLLGLGIPLTAVNNKGETPLHVYSRAGKSNSSGFVPQGGPGTVSVDENLHFLDAVGTNAEDAYEILDNNGLGVVHVAAMTSEPELTKWVEAGADLGLLTKDSQNVLHLACRARRPGILCQILSHHSPDNVDINHKDNLGLTPLHVACLSGQVESVALLLKHRADIHAQGPWNMTALHFCAHFPLEQGIWDSQILQAWIRGPPRGPLRPGSQGHQSPDPWYLAPSYGVKKPTVRGAPNPQVAAIAKLLIKAGSDVAAPDENGSTALDVALRDGCAEFVELFASDEELLQKATTPTEISRITRRASGDLEHPNQKMRAHLALARPRSGLPNLRVSQNTLDEVRESPHRYLDLLTIDDAAELINEAFEAEPSRASHYSLLKDLLKPAKLAIAEKTPQLVNYYSSDASARGYIEKSREAGDRYYDLPALTTLQMACQAPECNLETLRFLVEMVGVDVNARSACHDGDRYSRNVEIVPGGTALHVLASAKYYWKVEGLRYLLEHGAEVDALDEKGRSALHIAAGKNMDSSSGHDSRSVWGAAATRVLLDHGGDPNLLDKFGLSPVCKASATPQAMQELLARGANPTLGKRLPLFEVIFDQNLAALELLLDNGVDVNSVDETRRALEIHYTLKTDRKLYAVICAAFATKLNHGFKDLMPLLRTLVVHGADLYVPLNEEETAVHFLFEFPELPVQNELLSEPCVSRIDFSRRDQRGRTVLMASSAAPHLGDGRRDNSNTLVRILGHGGDATLVDNGGKSALHHLLMNEHPNDDTIVEFINREEVRPTLLLRDNDGYTPLHYALRFLRPEICELLLSKGANILEADPTGRTALHHIANQINRTRRPSPSVLEQDLPADYPEQCLALWNRFLAQAGSINAVDNEGNTPLHLYLLSDIRARKFYPDDDPRSEEPCHLQLYHELFPPTSGVDVLAVNKEGETMLHVTARRQARYGQEKDHDKKVFVALVAKGLDPLREDKKGRSALDVASACEKEDIVGAFGRA